MIGKWFPFLFSSVLKTTSVFVKKMKNCQKGCFSVKSLFFKHHSLSNKKRENHRVLTSDLTVRDKHGVTSIKSLCFNNLFKKNLHILCSPSRAYYRADFHFFGLKMTVEEWSSAPSRKNWGFQSASLRKMHLKVLSRKQCVITGFPVLTLYCYKCNSQ